MRWLLLCLLLVACGQVADQAPTPSTAGTASNAGTVVRGTRPDVNEQAVNHLGTELREVPTTTSLTPAVFAGAALIGDWCTVRGDVAHTSSQERLLCAVDRSTARLRWKLA